MGTLGTQEMIVIFIMALLIFGPKKLPELGRTVRRRWVSSAARRRS